MVSAPVMNMNMRLAGRHTVAFRCGCLFALGDAVGGVAGWRLCTEHAGLRESVAASFGEHDGACVVACRLSIQRVRSA